MKNKRICLQEGWLGTEVASVLIDNSMMEETGLFDTESGKEDAMKYVTSGPGLWLVMTIANVKVTANMYDFVLYTSCIHHSIFPFIFPL